ncbi:MULTISPECIES: GTPase HflX [Treponema]|uniref:GTPase HflX n=1 Tax=Treponema denticola (strain ATCC 35405 / DSM 14222 / CIP 103919 / JCM 8153 / KCTC 15104) TaxID=243275 RepID=HFLX_TREDE|nr:MULTISPECIES: GTPase HflX [Treponema]Q73J26.1 RecName: Full=GTPase HflX; AltName: Full=GTP-binding protein HflX [Treponema denticola ATCC 35405]AAS13267.1 GTP-binding protein HflX, truncation [Treponema denticola ATCC 35405]EGC77746.1 GTP-binding protein HflX [Treponema denticola F0402]EMB37310.1 GTP-binding protein HflX [Treponema denticola ATCC 35404]EMB40880.1 GTP-binding protein HflX [Treponema denticola ATCC 33521]HCY95368.1 GTPase HflX [Treponema sp.]
MYITDNETKKALLIFTDIFSGPASNSHISRSTLQEKSAKALKEIEEKELKSLVETIFLKPLSSLRFRIAKENPATLVGSGQLEKIAQAIEEEGADLVVFNSAVSPRIQRNLEAALNTCVIDRSEVIIQIFADRAQTREAVLQAELARLEYSMPRLTRRWTSLAQQRGGAKGTRGASRGAGEKKLELDRRRLKTEITKLKKEVERVRLQRSEQRKTRLNGDKKIGAIVGYTNAGKSSLLKKLSGAEVFTEDKLFATLDAETRKVFLQTGEKNIQILLTDTVGFVSNLPHQLIDAFRSTLEEAALADFLIIVCDAAHPAMPECLEVTKKVLDELSCSDKPSIIAINKMDDIFDEAQLLNLKERYPEAVEISVTTGQGLEGLKKKITDIIIFDK